MSVCAVLLTRNRKDYLKQALDAVRAQTRRPEKVVVVDNASTDDSAEFVAAAFPEFEVLRLDQNLGSAGGYQQGMKWAFEQGYDALWFLDDDVRPEPDALARLLQTAESVREKAGDKITVQCLRVWPDGVSASLPAIEFDLRSVWIMPERIRVLASSRYPRIADLPEVLEVRDFASEGVLIPRRAIEACGLLNDDLFFYGEDTEYALRLSRAGYRHFLVSGARLTRMLASPNGRMPNWKLRYWIRNVASMRRAYGTTAAARFVTPWLWALRYFVPATAKGLWLRDWERYRAICKGSYEAVAPAKRA